MGYDYARRVIRKLVRVAAPNQLGTITHVLTQEPLAALTFDDGPHPINTPRLLDILERHQARATFFMLGEAAQRHPEIVRRVAESGHAIGNHSWDHPSFPSISRRERIEQIRACAKAISPYNTARLFRPPYGTQNLASRMDAFWLGHQPVTWNVTTDDWRGGDSILIATQVKQQIQPGSIIVLHDRLFDVLDEAYFQRESLLEAVDIFLHYLGGRFRFVTVPELLRHGRPQKQFWYKASDIELLNKLRRQDGPARRYATHSKKALPR